jgi:hypothetical protein
VARKPTAQLTPMGRFRPVHVHIALQQPATVLGQRRGVSYRFPISKSDKPVQQYIMVDALAS